jgi:hypothetical protein
VKRTKKLLAMVLMLVLIASITTPAYASTAPISVSVDGEMVRFGGQGPVIVAGRTLVPIRGVFELLGYAVNWDGFSQQVTLTGDSVIVITIGNRFFTTDGVFNALDVPAQVINGRTMLPIRAVLESVNHDVGWNAATNTVIITTRDSLTLYERLYEDGDRSLETLIGVGYPRDQVERAVYQRMTALRPEYPHGMRWTNNQSYAWNGGVYSRGYGCVAFAFILSDAAFGNLRARRHYYFDNIRVGDIIRINNDTHSVIVLSINDNGITIAEGNFNSSVYWGRTLSWRTLQNNINYVLTRYPDI